MVVTLHNKAHDEQQSSQHALLLTKLQIQAYILHRKWALRARESLGSTRAITTKYNELFDALVTERYRSLFEETLRQFRSDMALLTSSGKGDDASSGTD